MIHNKPNPNLYSYDVCPWCAYDLNRTPSVMCAFILTCMNPSCGKSTHGMSNSLELERIFYEEKEKGNHRNPYTGV